LLGASEMSPLLLLLGVAVTSVHCEGLLGQQLTVTTFPRAMPFLEKKHGHEDLVGNDKYEGIIADLLKELSTSLGFTYTIKTVADNKYGMLDNSGEWTGMIGEVVRGEADLAVADLTVTAHREAAVDFTHPYMSLGLGVLYSRRGLHRRDFQSLEDLTRLDSVKVGAVPGGSTERYFRDSKMAVHQRVWAKMQQDAAMTQSNQEGMTRVLEEQGGYAFVMESPTMDYMVARNCDLIKVGDIFSRKNYALALPQGSPHREEINRAPEAAGVRQDGADCRHLDPAQGLGLH
jgi:ABC-type amino acid transport substrate-binding protein